MLPLETKTQFQLSDNKVTAQCLLLRMVKPSSRGTWRKPRAGQLKRLTCGHLASAAQWQLGWGLWS